MTTGIYTVAARREAYGARAPLEELDLVPVVASRDVDGNRTEGAELHDEVLALTGLSPHELLHHVWLHPKTGGVYVVLGFYWERGRLEENDRLLHVVYRSQSNGTVWYRPAFEWGQFVDEERETRRFVAYDARALMDHYRGELVVPEPGMSAPASASVSAEWEQDLREADLRLNIKPLSQRNRDSFFAWRISQYGGEVKMARGLAHLALGADEGESLEALNVSRLVAWEHATENGVALGTAQVWSDGIVDILTFDDSNVTGAAEEPVEARPSLACHSPEGGASGALDTSDVYNAWVNYAVSRDPSVRLADGLWSIARRGEYPEGFKEEGTRAAGDSRGFYKRTVKWSWSDTLGALAEGVVCWDGRRGAIPFYLSECKFTRPQGD